VLRRLLPVLLILAASGCGGESAPPDLIPPEIPPAAAGAPPLTTARNVLLITVDTLRADRLGCYGYKAAETPVMDALAARGVRFETSCAHVPITLPSHASILTGLEPCAHGLHDNGTYTAGDGLLTLAEIFKGRGYATGAVVGSHVLDSRYGLDQGFDVYDDDFTAPRRQKKRLFTERQAEEVAQRGMEWLTGRANARLAGREDARLQGREEEPFFLWLHFFDPHMGYEPPEPFRSRFRRDLYSGEIAYTDYWIGKVLEHLAALGNGSVAARTITVLTADHGEALGEHGEDTHAFFIYQSTIRVPLIVQCPGFAPGVAQGLARGIDIVPTLLELLGIDADPGIAGRSLVPAMRGAPRPRLCYLETEMPLSRGWAPLRGVTNDRWKFIEAPRPELYDLEEDPGETRNIYGERSAIAGRLREELERLLAAGAGSGAAERKELTREEREIFEALGYAAGARGDIPEGDLPDPKDRVKVFTAIQRAWALADTGRKQEALDVLEEARREDPRYLETLTSIGAICLELDRNDEAVGAYRAALEVDPESTLALNGAAAGCARLGRMDEALRLVGQSMALDPENAKTHNTKANIYIKTGDLDTAAAACREGLAAAPDSADLHNTLGMILLSRKDAEGAAAAFSEAAGLDGELWLAFYNLGRALGRLERHAEAVEALEKARSLNPRDPRVTRALAHACYQSAVGAMMKSPPDPAAARRKAQRAEKLGYSVPAVFWLKLKAEEESGGR